MVETEQIIEGLHLHSLAPGTTIDAVTKSHHYRIEYLGGDEVRISGHPAFCPTPVAAHLRGSMSPSGLLHEGYVGRGMRMVFRRQNDALGIVTSEVTGIRDEHTLGSSEQH